MSHDDEFPESAEARSPLAEVTTLHPQTDAARLAVVRMVETLLVDARAGKLRDFAYVATLHEDPDRYAYGVSHGAHIGRVVLHLNALWFRLLQKMNLGV